MAGYSRLIGADEEGTLNWLRTIRTDLIDPKDHRISRTHRQNSGDGLLVEFTSVVNAVRCATEIQKAMAVGNAEIAAEKRLDFEIPPLLMTQEVKLLRPERWPCRSGKYPTSFLS